MSYDYGDLFGFTNPSAAVDVKEVINDEASKMDVSSSAGIDNDVIETIKEDIETIKRQAAREESEKENFKLITEKARYKKKFREDLMKEKIEEIQQLELEKKEIQQNLK